MQPPSPAVELKPSAPVVPPRPARQSHRPRGAGRSGIPHRLALAEPDRHRRRLIGVSYFLKFAFDNNWIGPAGRVAIGLLAGIAVVVWSESFRRRGYVVFSYSLKAVGIGVLYLSLYAAFQVYSLVPSGVAFAMMLAVTAATAVMAWTQDAEILAAFALIGGFTTPLLLSTGQNREVALFAYVAILDLGALALVILKPWRRLLVLSYVGTLGLYIGWYTSFYDLTQVRMTVGFATLFFAIFAIAPLLARPAAKGWMSDSVPPLVAVVNAAGYFLQIYIMFEEIGTKDTAWFALALAALYIFLSRQARGRAANPRRQEPSTCCILRSPSGSSRSLFPYVSMPTGSQWDGSSKPQCSCGWPTGFIPNCSTYLPSARWCWVWAGCC